MSINSIFLVKLGWVFGIGVCKGDKVLWLRKSSRIVWNRWVALQCCACIDPVCYSTSLLKNVFCVNTRYALPKTLTLKKAEQNRTLYFIGVKCTVSCQIHDYNIKFTNGHNRCLGLHDLTTKS